MFLTETQYVHVEQSTSSTLWYSSRCASRLWNVLHEHCEEAKKSKEPCGYTAQKRLLPAFKEQDARFKDPSSQQLQEVVKEYHGALKSFFEKRKNGDTECNPPSFRKSGRFYPLHFPQRYNSFIIEDSTLKLAFGTSRKTWLTIPLQKGNYDNVKTVRICFDEVKKQFFVCLHREIQEKPVKKEGLKVYFDPGCKTTLTGITSEGRIVEYDINPLRKLNMSTYKLIDSLMSERDKKTKHSLRWRRLNKRIQCLWRKLKQRTKTYLHTLANRIFDSLPNLSEVYVGDWEKQKTLADTGYTFVNKRINRAVQNNNPVKTLVSFLSYKGKLRHGVCVYEFDERGTTRTCSQCGHEQAGGVHPSVREFVCSSCGFSYPRDWQSGLNFIRKFEPAVWNGLDGQYPSSSMRKTLAPFSCKTQRVVRTEQLALAS